MGNIGLSRSDCYSRLTILPSGNNPTPNASQSVAQTSRTQTMPTGAFMVARRWRLVARLVARLVWWRLVAAVGRVPVNCALRGRCRLGGRLCRTGAAPTLPGRHCSHLTAPDAAGCASACLLWRHCAIWTLYIYRQFFGHGSEMFSTQLLSSLFFISEPFWMNKKHNNLLTFWKYKILGNTR